MVGRAASVMLVFLLLAGCSGSPAPGVSGPTGSGTATGTSGPGNDGNATAALGEPWRVTLYFNGQGGLQREMPANGSVPIGTPMTGFASGFDPATFAQDALGHAVLIGPDDVVAQLFVTSQAPQVSNGAFDLALWFGSSTHKGLGRILTGERVALAGTPQVFDITLPFADRVPLFVEADDEVTVAVTGAFGGESGEPRLLVGPGGPSWIEFTVRNYTADPLKGATPIESQAFSGEVTNASGPACAPMQGSDVRHEVTVDEQAVLLRLTLERASSPAPVVDNDLHVYDGSRLVATSTSIFADEAVLLAADALEGLQGKTLGVVVHGCGPGPVQYDLEAEQSVLPA